MNPGRVLLLYCLLWIHILPSSTCFSVLSSQYVQSSGNPVTSHDPAMVAPEFGSSIHKNENDRNIVTEMQQQQQQLPKCRLVLVDVENVRGKTNFQQTHETVIARVCALARKGQQEKEEVNVETKSITLPTPSASSTNTTMLLVMDHGAERTIQMGGPLTNQVAVVFAGPHQ